MRSLLFVPADSDRKLAKAMQCEADALIVDLEDSKRVSINCRRKEPFAMSSAPAIVIAISSMVSSPKAPPIQTITEMTPTKPIQNQNRFRSSDLESSPPR